MKESINFYYNLNVSEVEKWGDIYRFNLRGEDYYFTPSKRSEKEIMEVVLVSKELKARGVECHDILVNRMGKIITNVYNTNYILLKPIGNSLEEISLYDMIKFNKTFILNSNKSKLYQNNWGKLWSDKVDYFEYQVHEIGKDKTVILNSFSYYVGLAENAICYVNVTTSKYQPGSLDKVCLSHRRINFPNYKLNYLNPLSFIFDLEVRDIASFIKSSFFHDEDALSYLKEVLRTENFSIYSLQLLYARLLYPSYYFDIYEQVMNDNEDEEKLVPITLKASNYERFLKEAYLEINKYAPIERIEWILDK